MYYIIYVIAGIWLFATCSVFGDNSTNLVSINYPIVNQMLNPSQLFMVQYTMNGVQENNKELPNYPNSMDVIFRWTEKNNTQRQPIEFLALNGLNTDAYPGGIKNQIYSHRWKLPNCHFFRRYMPSEWSFSLIFHFKYPEIHNLATANNNANTAHTLVTLVPLGPEQANTTIPIDIYFNATLMADHHKGC